MLYVKLFLNHHWYFHSFFHIIRTNHQLFIWFCNSHLSNFEICLFKAIFPSWTISSNNIHYDWRNIFNIAIALANIVWNSDLKLSLFCIYYFHLTCPKISFTISFISLFSTSTTIFATFSYSFTLESKSFLLLLSFVKVVFF